MTSDELYQRAYKAHYKDHDAETASAIYREVIQKFPASQEARYAETQIANIGRNRDSIEQKHASIEQRRGPIARLILTTAPNLDGYRVKETIGIVSAARVLGIGRVGDVFMQFTDYFGGRSSTGEGGFDNAVQTCFSELKYKATSLESDAVIAASIQCGQFSGQGKSMLWVVAAGTAVKLEKVEQSSE